MIFEIVSREQLCLSQWWSVFIIIIIDIIIMWVFSRVVRSIMLHSSVFSSLWTRVSVCQTWSLCLSTWVHRYHLIINLILCQTLPTQDNYVRDTNANLPVKMEESVFSPSNAAVHVTLEENIARHVHPLTLNIFWINSYYRYWTELWQERLSDQVWEWWIMFWRSSELQMQARLLWRLLWEKVNNNDWLFPLKLNFSENVLTEWQCKNLMLEDTESLLRKTEGILSSRNITKLFTQTLQFAKKTWKIELNL